MVKTAASAKIVINKGDAIGCWSVHGNNQQITKSASCVFGETITKTIDHRAKILLIMKLTIILITAVLLNVSAKSISQQVSFSGKNVSLETVLSAVKKQTGYVFLYSEQVLLSSKPVSITAKDLPLDRFLAEVFKGQPLEFIISGRNVFINPKLLGNVSSKVYREDTLVTIKGTVTAEEGVPLPGATVQVRGTSIGTMTNAKGQFILNGASPKSTLIISYTGYKPEQYVVKDNETLIVSLKRNIGALDETVVIAYGTSTRRRLTGSIGRVTAEDIGNQPVQNPLQALQGRVAGLVVNQNSGISGGNYTVQIRGQNSLRNRFDDNGNQPLYIIDGVPFFSNSLNLVTSPFPNVSNNPVNGISPLNNINPADILSIEILKDADATAIYGSKGANGVILITTKKGQVGQLSVEANVYSGIGNVTRRLKLLNTQQYLEMRREAFKNDNLSPGINDHDLNGNWNQNHYTDWQKEFLGGTARMTDGQLSISGGSENLRYRISTGYHRETSVFPGDFVDQRASMQVNLGGVSFNGKFRNEFSVSYAYGNSNLLNQDLTRLALTLAPNTPALLDSAGNLAFPIGISNNPLAATKRPYDNKSNNLIGNLVLSYELPLGIILKSNFGYTNTTLKETSKQPRSSFSPSIASIQNSTSFGNSSVNSWIIEPQLSWSRNIANGRIDVLFGSTFQSQIRDQLRQNASGFLNESMMDNIAAATASSIVSSFIYAKTNYNALFGRLTYNAKGKYLMSLTGRRDGSSRFGPGKQFSNFGSIGAAWIFSAEHFMANNFPFLSFGKLRGSYGTTGSDQIPDYQFLNTYSSFSQYQGTPGLIPSRLFNPEFSWEANRKIEGALELGFIKDLILISLSYYNNRSSNQLVGYTLPPTTGFAQIQYNLPATVQNTGIEIEVKTTNIKRGSFLWNTSFNLTIPRNKLLNFPNLKASSAYANKLEVGKPLAINKTYEYAGVDPATGLYQIRDINNNGTIGDIGDLAKVCFTGQNFYGGLQNSLTYKGIQMDFLFQFVKQVGNNYLSQFAAPGIFSSATNSGNQPIDVLSRWQKAGDMTNIQKFGTSGTIATPFSRVGSSDYIFSDASFIRLKNVSLSYQFPNNILKAVKLKGAKVYFQAQNLITITNYKGLDPENQILGLPPLRVLTAGIQLTL